MKTGKKVLLGTVIAIVSIIALLLVVSLFTKKEWSITRTATINKSAAEVYNYVSHVKNQDNYNFWVMQDPAMKKTYTGEDGTVGFVYAWDSENKNAGSGEQKIVNLEPNRHVDIDLHFIKPFEGVADSHIGLEELAPGQTKVTYTFNSVSPWPHNAMLLIMPMEKMMGTPMETTLDNLKAILEKQ